MGIVNFRTSTCHGRQVPSQDIDAKEQNNTYDVAQYVHTGGKRPKEHENQSPKIEEKEKRKRKEKQDMLTTNQALTDSHP